MRLLGVEGGRVLNIGRFNPPTHRGLDVFASPGSSVVVPVRSTMQILRTTFDPGHYKAQVFGWIVMCGKRYGFVIAHLAAEPELGHYEAGDLIGKVAGHVDFTPHAHWALSPDGIPPPGTVDPYETWKKCVARTVDELAGAGGDGEDPG